MNKQKDNVSLEQALDQYFSAPVPRKEFLANLEKSLQAVPGVTSQSLPKINHHITFRPVYAFLTVGFILIISFLVVGPANAFAALQGLIRYIPGFGLVDEKTPLRVLAEPVSVTREGVTVIVKQAVLSPEQVSITYSVKGIPAAAKPAWVASENGKLCIPVTEIHLQDGTLIEQQEGGRGGYDEDNNYQYVVKFRPIPSGDNQAIWSLPCIPYTLSGKAPSDWVIPLRFMPAPANLTQMPVVEVAPTTAVTGTPQGTASAAPGSNAVKNPLSLDRVVETQKGYIFIGRFRQVLPIPVQPGFSPEIRDGNGLLLGHNIPADITTSGDITDAIEWAYQVNKKDLTWPVTIRFNNAGVFCTDPQAKITFDTGSNPKGGQVWEINQDFSLDPCQFRVQFIKWIGNGYLIRLTDLVNTNGVQFSPHLEGPMFAGGPGGSTAQYPNHMDVSVTYDQEPPKGLITLYISAYGWIPGPWQVQWQPNK